VSSVKLTISLLIFIAFVSIIGTLIPQNLSEVEYLRRYSVASYHTLRVIGFFDLYHSWWFILLLFLLCLNLFACSIKNLPRTWKIVSHGKPVLADDEIKALAFNARIEKKISLEEAKGKIISLLRKNFGSPRETLEKGTVHLFSERARYSRLGFFITHLSVIIILIGGLIGSVWGFKGQVEIIEGTSTHQIRLQKGFLYDLGFDVRCDDFNVTYYPNSVPKDYKSTLTVFENGKKIITKIIEVNHPLTYKGFVFYQESFGEVADQGGEVTLLVRKKGSDAQWNIINVGVGGSFFLPETGMTVKVNRFFPDLVLDEQGVVINRSSKPNNPALELLIYQGEKLQTRTWVFQNFPDFHGNKGEYQFLIQNIKGRAYTGLQVTKDPGVVMVWIGCIFMVLGIFVTFFFFHQQVWIRIRTRGDKLELVMAGTAYKNRIAFEKVFEKLKADIEKI